VDISSKTGISDHKLRKIVEEAREIVVRE